MKDFPARMSIGHGTLKKSAGLSRRRALQTLLAGAGSSFALSALPSSHPAHTHLNNPDTLDAADAQAESPDWKPAFLDAHQNETLVALAERIVPGSKKVEVNRFIDLALSIETPSHQRLFLLSLAAMDGDALRRFHQPFKSLDETGQMELLKAASEAEPSYTPAHRGTDWVSANASEPIPVRLESLRDSFDHLKGWVVAAYYSTEAGMRELGWTGNSFFEDFPGCPHPKGHG
jgi:hypothetical protein